LVEYRALDVLEAEEVLTPSELSSLLRIPRSNATLVLQKLEGANLIHIEEDVDDGRQRIVTLTEAGTKKASTLRRAANEVTQAMHSPIKQNGSMVVDAWYMRMYLNLSAEQPY
ncbi:MAG: MarR family transcriptional regulator, partial [Adlercreutzia sp.]|nr:MarR family transcriptional regulator [Adlercreutzia sp.]